MSSASAPRHAHHADSPPTSWPVPARDRGFPAGARPLAAAAAAGGNQSPGLASANAGAESTMAMVAGSHGGASDDLCRGGAPMARECHRSHQRGQPERQSPRRSEIGRQLERVGYRQPFRLALNSARPAFNCSGSVGGRGASGPLSQHAAPAANWAAGDDRSRERQRRQRWQSGPMMTAQAGRLVFAHARAPRVPEPERNAPHPADERRSCSLSCSRAAAGAAIRHEEGNSADWRSLGKFDKLFQAPPAAQMAPLECRWPSLRVKTNSQLRASGRRLATTARPARAAKTLERAAHEGGGSVLMMKRGGKSDQLAR